MSHLSIKRSVPLPMINGDEDLNELADKVAIYITKVIRRPASFDELNGSKGKALKVLCNYLSRDGRHSKLPAVLMALKGHFTTSVPEDIDGVNAARALACEFIAIRYASRLNDKELIAHLLLDIPGNESHEHSHSRPQESSPLLGYERRRTSAMPQWDRASTVASPARDATPNANHHNAYYADLFDQLKGLNALEIAAVSGAKKFLGDRTVQRIIEAIWNGDIIFWSALSSNATKEAQIYKAAPSDIFSRLRVPKYLKAFEALFFIGFLALYYAVLVQQSYDSITAAEVLLYVWVASFAYNEIGEYNDAGTAFYLLDFWTLWDLGIVLTGAAFLVCRIIGVSQHSERMTAVAFDVLAMEALFLVPRLFSLLSLHPYFGTLLPCLRDMTKDFLKFLSLVVILYLGFLTTFSLLARDRFTFRKMSWILVKVFFGSSYLGFDVAEQISPILGPPLMLVFVCMTNILLVTSLISILSNSLTKVIEHAADEYKFVYSVFVLEASTSDRLTYFLPPLNLIPLALRPLRLFMSAGQLRDVRIVLLKACHLPHVAAIQLYEKLRGQLWQPKATSLPIGATPDRSRLQKRYSRASRLSLPQTPLPEYLKPAELLRDDLDGTSNSDDNLADLTTSMKALEATVARLTRQVEDMTTAKTGS